MYANKAMTIVANSLEVLKFLPQIRFEVQKVIDSGSKQSYAEIEKIVIQKFIENEWITEVDVKDIIQARKPKLPKKEKK